MQKWRMPSAQRSAAPRWKKVLLWTVPVLLVLAVGGFFIAKAAVDAYLRSERFRVFIAQRAGDTLHAETELAPLRFDSASLYTNDFSAQGSAEAAFSKMELAGIRAELSGRRFLERVWQVDRVTIQRVEVQLEGPRVSLPPKPERLTKTPPESRGGGWLPNRVEISDASIQDATIAWEEGELRGSAVQFKPGDGGWNIEGTGGHLRHGSLPPLDVQRLTMRYREPSLFVQSAEFRQGAGGSVVVAGEVNFKERLELRATLKNITLTPYLAGDWRARLKGDVSGDVAVRSPLPASGPPEIRGSLAISNGHLEALPVLNEIAAFTRTQQFRKVQLTRASGDFIHIGDLLDVQNFVAESAGLIRIEGAFRVEASQIDGTFQVGVVPSSLQWLPGSQTRVFTETRDGYLWAPMRLTGPVGAPKEDLSARLVAAAGGAVIEQVETTIKDAAQGVRDAAKGALDLLFAPLK